MKLSVIKPALYHLVQVLGMIQVLYFTTYGLKFQAQDGTVDFMLHQILEFLPIFPRIISQQGTFVAALLTLFGLNLLFVSFLVIFVLKLRKDQRKQTSGESGKVMGTAMLSTLSLMQLKGEAEASRENTKADVQQDGNIKGFFKVALRAFSIYFILQTELLTVPGYVLSLVPLMCRSVSYVDKDGNPYSVLEDNYTGMKCWDGMHTLAFLCGILNLALLFASKVCYLYFMHDTFLLNSPPWTQFNLRPAVFSNITVLAYCMWFVFDLDKAYGTYVNLGILACYFLILSFRYLTPIFPGRMALLITCIIESSRFWITFMCCVHGILSVNFTAIGVTIAVLTGFAVCWIYTD